VAKIRLDDVARIQREHQERAAKLRKHDRIVDYKNVFHSKDAHRQWLWSFKRRPCADCGKQYPPYVMQFDHLDGSTKAFNLSQSHGKPRAAVLEEIAKCEIVCANCHAARTYERFLQGKVEAHDAPATDPDVCYSNDDNED
jgi:hypothetical protein